MTLVDNSTAKRLGILCFYDKNGRAAKFLDGFLEDLTRNLSDLVVIVLEAASLLSALLGSEIVIIIGNLRTASLRLSGGEIVIIVRHLRTAALLLGSVVVIVVIAHPTRNDMG